MTQYLPQLRGTAYEGVSLENVLQMVSGVAWNEDYTDPSADVSLEIGMTDRERLAFIGSKPRATDPGTQFNYSTGETHLVGAVLRSAIDGSLAEFLASRIWGPFGMEHPANWRLVEPDGGEHGGCCISASLRDYARIGLFALGDGVLPDGRRVLPAGWMEASTAPSATNPGYGYLWWLSEDGYSARGIFGQGVFVFPEESTVVALHSAWPEPVGSDFSTHRDSFIEAVRRALVN
ncbi:MAG: serine hydrolase [Gemmatimonadetes bacterium]|nr:serine hydrolase [Gemmatimonadota bacterium]